MYESPLQATGHVRARKSQSLSPGKKYKFFYLKHKDAIEDIMIKIDSEDSNITTVLINLFQKAFSVIRRNSDISHMI